MGEERNGLDTQPVCTTCQHLHPDVLCLLFTLLLTKLLSKYLLLLVLISLFHTQAISPFQCFFCFVNQFKKHFMLEENQDRVVI